jgi:hypothetical protein
MNKSPKYKQWLGKNASIKSLKRYCLEIWSELIKDRDKNKCFLCGSEKYLQSHHMISKKWTKTAFEINCGICLCGGCHSLKVTSAHCSPWFLENKIANERPEQYKWYLENRALVKQGTQEKIDYKKELEKLFIEYNVNRIEKTIGS